MIYTNKINSQIPIRTLNLRYLIILVVSFLTISILTSVELVYADPVVSLFFGESGKGNGQFESPEDISCNMRLQLVLFNDGISKCVKIDSIDKLFERG